MQQNIFEMLNYEQIFEYKRLQRMYSKTIADNYARTVTGQSYLNRDPRTDPRPERFKTKKVTFKVGDRISTEIFSEKLSPNAWHNITSGRIVSGVITKIKGDSVSINCDVETVVALLDRCWREKW